MSLCGTCPRRDTCIELCPAAEKYVNQDHVSQRELPQPNEILDLFDNELLTYQEVASFFTESSLSFPFLSELENKCLYFFYFEGLSYKQITVKVNCKLKAVDHCLYRARKKIRGVFSIGKGEL